MGEKDKKLDDDNVAIIPSVSLRNLDGISCKRARVFLFDPNIICLTNNREEESKIV